ncbi:PIG-L family deacetylase [Jatrophihabitans sp.]|uniref:PIG-L family deacetylase n=1 Tax=Jatrophihabitans sp. TaxID=1932789 RepID=UPI002C8FEC72|nr:bifunctional PIG-L family deacetylase/class I SAM-dependent methyltransferase [Jatrophihabitans sp.]
MRAFSPSDEGVPPSRWRAEPWWDAALPVGLPPAGTRLVVLAAHPDDETLGVGGLLHAAGRAGLDIQVVVASDGRASHPHSPTHSPDQLAARRRAELSEAVGWLAPRASVVELGLPDGRLTEHGDDIAAGLTLVLGPDTDCWLLSTWRSDGHPDHTACGLAAQQVAAARTRTRWWEYPVWLWHAGDPVALRDQLARDVRRFSLDPVDRQARTQALAAYRSQVEPLSVASGDEAVLPPAVLAHADRDRELLLDPGSHAAADDDYFPSIYRSTADPWSFESGWYERRKRSVLLAALPRQRFRRTFEPGCARGDLSVLLAERTDVLVAAEWAEAPLAAARHRLAGHAGVELRRLRVPEDWPVGRFDLVVLSEIAYYLPDLELLAQRVLAGLDTDGVVALMHWRRCAPDHPHTAETVHLALRAALGLPALVRHEEDDFLLDVLARDGRSVAERDGRL